MKSLVVLALLVFLGGCASHNRVRCDERLEPINQAAPAGTKVAQPAATPTPRINPAVTRDRAKESR